MFYVLSGGVKIEQIEEAEQASKLIVNSSNLELPRMERAESRESVQSFASSARSRCGRRSSQKKILTSGSRKREKEGDETPTARKFGAVVEKEPETTERVEAHELERFTSHISPKL